MVWRRLLLLILCLTPGVSFAEDPFTSSGPTVTLAVTGTTGRVQVSPSSVRSLRVYNAGTVAAFIQCGGDNTVVATTAAGIPIAPSSVEVLGCQGATYVAAITASGTATLYLTPGAGI
jgi:hypothetical protein